MEPPEYGLDSVDYSTRLPPRKRLLASLKQKTSPPEPPILSIHFNSSRIRARIQELLNLSASSPQEGIEMSKSVVSEAEEIAAAARVTAMEKAMIAAKARAYARSVLEVLASLPKCLEHEDSCCSRVEGRQKQVAVRQFYDSKLSVLTCDDDEEPARRLHHSMNRSPRVKRSSNAKNETKINRKDCVVVRDKSSSLLREVAGELHDDDLLDKNGASIHSEVMHFDAEVNTGHPCGRNSNEIKSRVLKPGKKVGIKRKKLPLSQFDSYSGNGPVVVHESKGRPISTKQKTGPPSSLSCPRKDDVPISVDGVSDEKESTLNCKKLKLSQLYSERKILHPICSKTRLTTTSSVV